MLGGFLPWGIFSALAAELVPWRPLPSLQPELGGFLMVLLGRTLKPRAYSPHTQVHTRSQPEERGRVLHNSFRAWVHSILYRNLRGPRSPNLFMNFLQKPS